MKFLDNITIISGSITGSLFGTSSFSLTSSRATTSSYSLSSLSSSYTLTASYALNGGGSGNAFPYTGDAVITGSLNVTGSVTASFFVGDGSGLTNIPTGGTYVSGTGSYALPFSNQASITVTHNLDTQYPFVQVYNDSGFMIVPNNIQVLNSSSIEVTLPNDISGNISVAKGGHVIEGTLQNAVSASYADYIQSPAVRTHRVNFGVSSDDVITTGRKGFKAIGQTGRITGWRLLSDTNTNTQIDVWKLNNAIPTTSNSITGAGSKPSLNTSMYASSSMVGDWTTLFYPNDIFAIEVESNSAATYLYFEMDFLVDND